MVGSGRTPWTVGWAADKAEGESKKGRLESEKRRKDYRDDTDSGRQGDGDEREGGKV